MKGIKKLFYGLVFMALISVGFKIEAKAATLIVKTVKGASLDSYTACDISDPDAKLVGIFQLNPAEAPTGDYPDISTDGSATFTYNLKLQDVAPATPVNIRSGQDVVTVETIFNGSASHKVYLNGNEVTPVTNQIELFSYTRDQVKTYVSGATGTVTKTVKYKIICDPAPTPSGTPAPGHNPPAPASDPTAGKEITLAQVLGGAYCGDSKIANISCNGTEVTSSGVYMFPGETATFTTPTLSTDYQYIKWETTQGDLTNSARGTTKLTMVANPSTTTATTLKELYGTISFDPEITTATTVKPNVTSGEFTPTMVGFTTADIDGVFLDDTAVTVNPSWTGGKFTFKVPTGTAEGIHTLKIKLKTTSGGGTFTREFTVDNDDPVELDSVIYVTEGFDVLLSKFISSGSATKSVRASITSDAKSYASLDPSTASTKATNIGAIKVHGDSATKDTEAKTGKKHLILRNAAGTSEYDTANITVFPKPVVTVNPGGGSSSSGSLNTTTTTTSSSSSSDTPLRVDIPIGVYHGTRAWSDVKRATVIFSVSGKDIEKTLDMTTTDSNNKLIKYANVNSMALSSVLKDLCGSDSSKEVTVKAYPNDGSGYDPDVYGEAKFTAYRIGLDTTGGAKYTVNGSEVNDGYFYGVDGTTYTIKSTASNGGTLDKTNSGDFNNGETISLRVLGARTLKAVYTDKSKTPGTGGDSTDDEGLDPVPKTGESKTDIWILWSVLLVSILGAGFMIWKRFGLVRAIAQAEEEVAVAEHEEKVEAQAKEEENKLNMLKDLRNL